MRELGLVLPSTSWEPIVLGALSAACVGAVESTVLNCGTEADLHT